MKSRTSLSTVDERRVFEHATAKQDVLREESFRDDFSRVARHVDVADEAVEIDDWLLTFDLGVDRLKTAVTLQVLRLVHRHERFQVGFAIEVGRRDDTLAFRVFRRQQHKVARYRLVGVNFNYVTDL